MLSGAKRRIKGFGNPVFLLTLATVLGLDQLSKILLRGYLSPAEIKEIIPGFFNLIYLWNPGVAFGLFAEDGSRLRYFVVVANLLAAGGLFWYSRRQKRISQFFSGLIAGGALGNLIDRLLYGRVFDFLDFHLGPYHWPAFNLADAAITLGVLGFLWKAFAEA